MIYLLKFSEDIYLCDEDKNIKGILQFTYGLPINEKIDMEISDFNTIGSFWHAEGLVKDFNTHRSFWHAEGLVKSGDILRPINPTPEMEKIAKEEEIQQKKFGQKKI